MDHSSPERGAPWYKGVCALGSRGSSSHVIRARRTQAGGANSKEGVLTLIPTTRRSEGDARPRAQKAYSINSREPIYGTTTAIEESEREEAERVARLVPNQIQIREMRLSLPRACVLLPLFLRRLLRFSLAPREVLLPAPPFAD